MDEKTMINDVLNGIKADLVNYQEIITETENIDLRQMLQQLRNSDESFQYELYKIAQVKGYCTSVILADNYDIQNIKSELE